MTTLAEQMAAIVADNALTSISLNYHTGEGFTSYFHSYAHAGDGVCGSGGEPGDTPSEAIAKAIANLNERRWPQGSVPAELEAAA